MEKNGGKSCCVIGKTKIALIFALGILLIAAAVALYETMDNYIQSKIDEKLVLSPDSEGYAQWQDPSVPIYMQFFIFDVTNAEKIKKGHKPIVRQIGPFSYREYRPKKNITWHKSDASVSYNQEMSFVFDPTTSCAGCDHLAEVTTVNVPLVVLAEALRNLSEFERWVVKPFLVTIFTLFKENLFMKRRVHDLLWGYEDPIFLEYGKLREKYSFVRKYLPEINPVIALQKNNTFDGVTRVHTGEGDIKQLVQWMEWKGQHNLTVWKTIYANMINGTDGSQFSPGLSADDTLYVFVTQLCRSLYLTHTTITKIQGIKALQFAVPAKAFLNSSLNPDNRGFCTKECYPSGILDIGVCQPPSPVTIPLFISAPHFYLGDASLLEPIHGLSPNKEEHGTFLNVEPHTGISIKSAKRLQINLKVEPVEGIEETNGIPTMFFPIMFINESSTLDSATADQLKGEVLSKFTIVHGLELGLVILGGLLVLLAIVLLIRHVRYNRKQKAMKLEPLIVNASENSPLLWS